MSSPEIIKNGVYNYFIRPGKSLDLFISVSGIGDLEKNIVNFECVRSLGEALPDHHLIFVRDNSRSWYTNKDGWNELVVALTNYISANSINRVTIFGLSMGGFGALRLSKFVAATNVVALSPRTVLGSEGSFDPRNKIFFDQIRETEYGEAKDFLSADTSYTLIFSVDVMEDTIHAERMIGRKVKLLACRGDHNIAQSLQERGILIDFLQDSASDRITPEKYKFFNPKPEHFLIASTYSKIGRPRERAQFLSEIDPSLVPEYAFKELSDLRIKNSLISDSDAASLTAYPAHSSQIIHTDYLSKYLGLGWYKPEAFGVWGDGIYHVLKIFISDMPHVKKVIAKLKFQLYTTENCPHIHVNIYANRKQVFDIQRYYDYFLVEFITECQNLEIIIETPESFSPSELGKGGDNRKLSVGISKIHLTPALT